ncbi:MAG: hypothetical protein ABS43_14595 [Bordetella sp. SCN 67-23]|nr:ABC transporter permease [Burkholderiales bacterium]ODS73182.1 MAG: hypothetical protein ABS43_14595 [Bordetella sp. SCN 67-23]ODU95547.1 MAG: hypothetical protein ABT00_03610 [Bordetella sp. SCN 68-11]OJW95131.1 MAG: hypothetical protein BGO71_03560 [Burkholderiales bacterium 67-32]
MAEDLIPIEPSRDIGHAERRRQRLERLLSVATPLLILAAWEALVRAGLVDARLFSSPSQIAGTFWALAQSGELARHVGISLVRIGIGFALGAIPGVLTGVAIGLSPLVRAVLSPIIASLYPIPKIAIFPLIMVIFGIGEVSKYVLVAIAVFFFMAINSAAGVLNVERIYWDVGHSFRVGRLRRILTIALPGALPMIIAGIRLSLGVSLLVLVSAEFVGSKSGIGFLVWDSWQTFNIETMFVGIVVIGALGWIFFTVVDEFERRFLPWAPGNRR